MCIPTLQSRKLRLRKVKLLSQGHTVTSGTAGLRAQIYLPSKLVLFMSGLSPREPSGSALLRRLTFRHSVTSGKTAAQSSRGPWRFSWSPLKPCLEKIHKRCWEKTTHVDETDVGVFQFQFQLTVQRKRSTGHPTPWLLLPRSYPSGEYSAYGQGHFWGAGARGFLCNVVLAHLRLSASQRFKRK